MRDNTDGELSTTQAAAYVGVHRNTVLYWVRRNLIPFRRTPNGYTFRREDLDRLRDDPPLYRRNRKPPLPVIVTEAALAVLLMLGVGWREAPACEWCKRVMHPDVYGAAYARVRCD